MMRTTSLPHECHLGVLVAALVTFFGAGAVAGEQAGEGRPVRPVAVWTSSPIEVTVAFGAAVDPGVAANWRGGSIGFGREAAAVGSVCAIPAKFDGKIPIAGVRWIDQGRTAIVQTDPQSLVGSYFLPLPGKSATTGGSAYVYDLSGVELSWMDENGPGEDPAWMGWWPVLDSAESAAGMAGTGTHQTEGTLLVKPGRLTLSSLLTLPAGKTSFGFESKRPIEELTLGDQQAGPIETKGDDGLYRAELEVASTGEPSFLSVTMRTGAESGPVSVGAWYRTAGGRKRQAVERSRLLVPWAPVRSVSANSVRTIAGLSVPLAGGDPKNGKRLFEGQTAKCSQCHRFRGAGGNIGPELSEIGRKPIAEIYRSIAAPSDEIDPRYLTYTIATKEGQVLSGVVRSEGAESVLVLDTNSRTTRLARSQIRQIRPSANSVMPVGLAGVLGEGGVRDVIAYLRGTEGEAVGNANTN